MARKNITGEILSFHFRVENVVNWVIVNWKLGNGSTPWKHWDCVKSRLTFNLKIERSFNSILKTSPRFWQNFNFILKMVKKKKNAFCTSGRCWKCKWLIVKLIHSFVFLAQFFLGKRTNGWMQDGTCSHSPCIYLPVDSPETGRDVYFQRGPPACGRPLDETRPVLRFFVSIWAWLLALSDRLLHRSSLKGWWESSRAAAPR